MKIMIHERKNEKGLDCQKGYSWKTTNPVAGEVFILTFPFIELPRVRRWLSLTHGLFEDSCTTRSDELESISGIQCVSFYDPHQARISQTVFTLAAQKNLDGRCVL